MFLLGLTQTTEGHPDFPTVLNCAHSRLHNHLEDVVGKKIIVFRSLLIYGVWLPFGKDKTLYSISRSSTNDWFVIIFTSDPH